MSIKLTEWYPPDSKPVRKGVYRILPPHYVEFALYAYFDGALWYCYASRPDIAIGHFRRDDISTVQSKYWRGLKEPYTDKSINRSLAFQYAHDLVAKRLEGKVK